MSSILELLNKAFKGRQSEYRALMVGLDASGRTTLLYKMKLGEVVTTIPTIGFNVETLELPFYHMNLTCWDVGGCDRIRPLWRHYFQNTQLVMFFIDSNDRERLSEASEELKKIMAEPELAHTWFAVLANKQDMPKVMTPDEIVTKMELRSLPAYSKGTMKVFPTSGLKGDGVYEIFEWLAKMMKEGTPTLTPIPSPPSVSEPKEERKKELLELWLEQEDEPDEEFLHKFQTYTLDSWDHRTHLRIAWLYITREGRQKGKDLIFDGIKRFIQNSERSRKTTFHETMTYFWIHMVHYAIEATKNPSGDFKGFLLMNPQLSNGGLFLEYYNKDTMLSNPQARSQVVLPDKKPLPSLLSQISSSSSSPAPIPVASVSAAPPGSDEEFIQKFESLKLDRWNHLCFLRVIWCYLALHGRRKGVDIIFDSLKNLQKAGFHYSKTYFWIQMVDFYSTSKKAKLFDELVKLAPELSNELLYLDYYKENTINSDNAQKGMILPDKKPFPSIVVSK